MLCFAGPVASSRKMCHAGRSPLLMVTCGTTGLKPQRKATTQEMIRTEKRSDCVCRFRRLDRLGRAPRCAEKSRGDADRLFDAVHVAQARNALMGEIGNLKIPIDTLEAMARGGDTRASAEGGSLAYRRKGI